jgi:uncharacterized membrane protein
MRRLTGLSTLSCILVLVVACGNDVGAIEDTEACDSSPLTYRSFGEPFLLDWCRGCHSSGLPDDMRQGAPLGVDFDDLDLVRAYAPMIAARATTATSNMPPASGPSLEERTLLGTWLSCGAL